MRKKLYVVPPAKRWEKRQPAEIRVAIQVVPGAI
jgi:hypothetical protein